MNNFYSRIKNIEASLNRLKTFGLSSSSSVTTIAKTVTIPFKIVPYKVNYEWDNCAGQYSARITINWIGPVGLSSAYIKEPTNLANRRYALDRITDSDHQCQYGLTLMEGSKDDLAIFNSGGDIPQFNVVVEIVATADFSLTYTLRQEH